MTAPQPMPWRSSLRCLAIGRGISVLGREAAAVALAVVAWERGGGAEVVAAVLLAGELAYLVSAPAAGWLADHADRRRVMIVSDVAGSVVLLTFLVPAPVWTLVVLAALAGLVEAPFGAAARAAVPDLVPAEALDHANASLTRWRTAGFLAGPVLGGAGVVTVGAGAVFVLDAVSFLVSAALLLRLRGSLPAGRRPAEGAASGGLLEGARVIAGHPILRRVCGAWMVARVGFAIEMTAAVALGHGAAGGLGVGLLVGAFGGGALLGTTIAPATTRRLGDCAAVGAALLLLALGLGLVGLAPAFAFALVGAALAGAGDGVSVVAEEGLLQRSVPAAVRGRVLATYEALLTAASLAALAFAGVLVATIGPRGAFLAAAAICGLAATLPLAASRSRHATATVTSVAALP